MNAKSLFEDVNQQAQDRLLSAPILNKLTQLNTPQLHYLFSQLYYFVERFPSLLGLLLWHTTDDRIRFAIVDNLIDECGGADKVHNNDFSATHSGLLKKFILSMDLPERKLAAQSIQTDILLNRFKQFYLHSTTVEVLSSMTSMESMSTQWFNLLYSQLKQRNEFAKDDLYFFDLHTQLDEVHGSILQDVLMPLLRTENDLALFKHGVLTSVSHWTNFYNEITSEIDKIS